MSFAKLTLGHQWRAEEWPEHVEVNHNGGRGDGPRRYVPERTCRAVGDEISGGCSECRGWLDPECSYCPSCGARVLDEEVRR